MSAPALEHLLAVLYTDEAARRAFIENPRRVALSYGLSTQEAAALERVNPDALELAARSYAAKRASHASQAKRGWRRLF